MISNLLKIAETTPTAPFIIHETGTWDFASTARLALHGASWLAELGVQPGDRVVVAIGNRPLFLFCWFAVIARGAIVVPIAPEMFGDPLRYVASQSEANLVITEPEHAARMRADLAGLPPAVHAPASEEAFETDCASLSAAVPAPIDDGATVAILYTSGTTGLPKGVMIPSRSYRAIGEKITQGIGMTGADRIMTFLPLHHANPQMYSVMSALTVGCSIVLIPRFSASAFAEQVARFAPTGFTYVGTVLSILEKTNTEPMKSTLRWCVGGGAPRAVWQALAPRLGVEVHELYGMTETGGMVTMNTVAQARFGTVGAIRSDFEVAVVGDGDVALPAGRVGEIVVRPKVPYVMTTGYFRKPVETLEAMSNLWFHTGDLGKFDVEGFLTFEGRKKELIRRGGEMISPVEIELAALKHPAIADCAVVGVSDPILDEEIKLVAVVREAIAPEQIVEFLRTKVQKHMLPRYVEFIAEIPKTPTQKIQRFKLTGISAATRDLKAHIAAAA